MPIKIIDDSLEIPEINFDLSAKFWPQISFPVKEKYGVCEIRDAENVQNGLKAAFSECGKLFMEKIQAETKASFYLYVQHLFENTCIINKEMLAGKAFDIDTSDFASVRRSMRIILEQSTTLDLKGCPVFMDEIKQNINNIFQLLKICFTWATRRFS